MSNGRPASTNIFEVHPDDNMSQNLSNDNPPEPAVNEVKLVEGDVQDSNERVITTTHDHERNHVDNCHNSGAIAEHQQHSLCWEVPGDFVEVEDEVGNNNENEDDPLDTRGKYADPPFLEDCHLRCVSLPEQRSVEDMLFPPSHGAIGNAEIVLLVVCQADKVTKMP